MFEFLGQMDAVANGIEIITFIATIFIWVQTTRINRAVRMEQARQNKMVHIRLTNGSRNYELPVPIRGSEVTRGEILGRIGMIPIDPTNKLTERGFAIEYTSGEAFMRRIHQILDATEDTLLEISCNDREYAQFKFPDRQENG